MEVDTAKPIPVLESTESTRSDVDKIEVFKKRMLVWDSPVEYVNNMYGSHPNEVDGTEYFKEIFGKCIKTEL